MSNIRNAIEHFHLNVADIDDVPDSHSSEVYRLTLQSGHCIFVKIPFNKDKLFRELAMLRRLKAVIPVPEVVDFWEGNDEMIGALLLAPVAGTHIEGGVNPSLAFDIGRVMGLMHNVEMPGYGVEQRDGFKMLPLNDWRKYIKDNFTVQLAAGEDIMDPTMVQKCMDHFERVFFSLPAPDGPCVVHCDFRPGNILVTENRVSGVIDFESARGGSTEIDFTKVDRDIWQLFPDTREAFEQGYHTVRPLIALDKILPFYSFYDSVCAVAWCKRRGLDKNKQFYEDSIINLNRILL